MSSANSRKSTKTPIFDLPVTMKKRTSFQHGDLKLHYIKSGHGSSIILTFHGFGQNANHCLPLFQGLEATCTVYAFDLFLHGESDFPAERMHTKPLLPKEIKELFTAFFRSENIVRFDAFGFSLGSKTVLQLLRFFPDKIDLLHLAAPDGLTINPWYNFATRTRVGNVAFRFLLENPGAFDFLLNGVRRFNIPNSKVSKFVYQALDNQEKRQFVKNVWFVYKALTVNTSRLAGLVLTNNIEIHQYYGLYDTIIKPRAGQKLAARIDQIPNVKVLKTGHNLLGGNGLKKLTAAVRENYR